MALFNFLKSKQTTTPKFIGRHEQFCLTRQFLGDQISTLEIQIAINKDNSEEREIKNKLDELEKYISSEVFTNRFAVEKANKQLFELINRGYETCVLNNNKNLEDICLKRFKETNKYLVNILKKEGGSQGEELQKLGDLLVSHFALGSILNQINLGGLLKDSTNEQKMWVIMNSLFYNNQLVEQASSVLPPEAARKYVDELMNFAEKLVEQDKISTNDFNKIEKEARAGLSFSEKNLETDL